MIIALLIFAHRHHWGCTFTIKHQRKMFEKGGLLLASFSLSPIGLSPQTMCA